LREVDLPEPRDPERRILVGTDEDEEEEDGDEAEEEEGEEEEDEEEAACFDLISVIRFSTIEPLPLSTKRSV